MFSKYTPTHQFLDDCNKIKESRVAPSVAVSINNFLIDYLKSIKKAGSVESRVTEKCCELVKMGEKLMVKYATNNSIRWIEPSIASAIIENAKKIKGLSTERENREVPSL